MYKEATGEEAVISLQDVDIFKRSMDPLLKSDKLGALRDSSRLASGTIALGGRS